jgi:hypothetical protein
MIFTGGFAMALLLRSFMVIISRRRLNIRSISLSLPLFIYFGIRMVDAWLRLENVPVADFKFVVMYSLVIYHFALCNMLYLSMTRVSCFFPLSKLEKWAMSLRFVLPGMLFAVLTVRYVYYLLQNTGNGQFPISTALFSAALFPILILKAMCDVGSVIGWRRLYKEDIKKRPKIKTSVDLIGLYLMAEMILLCVSLVVSVLEAVGYKGDAPAYVDFILVAWSACYEVDMAEHFQLIGLHKVNDTNSAISGLESELQTASCKTREFK